MQQIASDIGLYGLLIVFINVLLAEGGIPLPAFPILAAAGALVTKGPCQIIALVTAGFCGCMLADLAWYWSGKRHGARVLRLLCKVSLSPDFCVRQTETMFLKVGKWSLLFAKFFPALSTISVAMAGVTKMPLHVFFVLNGVGALFFVIVAVLVGWIFRDAFIVVFDAIADIGKLGGLFIVLVLCLYLLSRWWRRIADRRIF
jgi:membrane protein DedA with SNARE-associated domain